VSNVLQGQCLLLQVTLNCAARTSCWRKGRVRIPEGLGWLVGCCGLGLTKNGRIMVVCRGLPC
jgi:hypothetical protein